MNEKCLSVRTAFKKIFFLTMIIALNATTGLTASVTLSWHPDPNHPAPEGYRVFMRQAGQNYDYSQPDWEGDEKTCTLTGLEDLTPYYFIIRTYEGDVESNDSEEVYYAPPTADSDGDGLPDVWEIQFGLDYLTDDTGGDLDDDGISNGDEFRAGLEPNSRGSGTPPNPPVVFYPDPDAEVETTAMLELADYSDVDGDANIATQWQVYDIETGTCLIDVLDDHHLTLLPLPELLLTGNRAYRWRARVFDSGGLSSDWSADSYFSTQVAVDDEDGNGIPDDQEGDPVHAHVIRSLVSPAVFSEPTSMEVSSMDTGSTIERIALLDPAVFDAHETTPTVLPSAMLAYKLVLDQPGQGVLLTIHLSAAAPAEAQWMGYDQINGWKSYTDQAVFSEDRKSLTLEVRDGGFDDTDGIANGIILNTAGLQPVAEGMDADTDTDADTDADANADAAIVDSGGSGGGGGCFLASLRPFLQDETYAWD
jgi:chitinase